eukprot:Protomagalhaensia_sp_Gyna_25__5923@NODE_903_length_2437_cov_95_803169_g712_i0_p2_GENE_NODE_903_length_2437_cov_95_803169_g712_i0NODE_903_length_2437_cov_95_803169_g712_i0_p2_ORF_typecomplete_len199_score39_36VMA21/PF09446_10/7_7e03VMA21/PF09446_10/6_5e06Herpes_LMP1/PF05297_11/0_015PTR2/PF00854_21/0_015FAM176/PF14851_6/0_02LRR19TM/PF15176_6/0_048MFS_1/PF07690_16/0_06Ly49/PF08391_10/0_084Protocadherin/PF08374_11/0_085Mucin/PF01456_17/0_11HemY_N/PF07219_13/0_38DUF4820/PF16091_5/0_41DUF4834/PF16118_
MKTFFVFFFAQQVPPDTHPLAREDGGWYPGKHFDPTDILTDPKNWIVWKQFLIFFFSMIFAPVIAFVVVEYGLRKGFGLGHQRSQIIGAVCAMLCLQILMLSYARIAVHEEHHDYAEQQAAKKATKDTEEATETLTNGSPEKAEASEEDEESDVATEDKADCAESKLDADAPAKDVKPIEEPMPEQGQADSAGLKKRK